ncbi:MAG: peptidase S10 [Candidatus Schekmanbacteria bacterium]|nr:peptidase S10 [Candidatus Schekmanbacteria bacterium]
MTEKPQERRQTDESRNAEKRDGEAETPKLEDVLSETEHAISFAERTLEFTVTAGTMVLREENSKPKASIFFVAYARRNAGDVSQRPVTFIFNGGPGSSAVWLHLGFFGPWRVELTDEGFPLPPPGRLIPNPATLLWDTDLVLIDPVTTGYSRAAKEEDAKSFYEVKKDIETVGDFIRLYVTRYQRWASPKYIAGESYGTTRAAGLAGYLHGRHSLYVNGVILISVALDFHTLIPDPGNDLPYVLMMPTLAATAFYHRRLQQRLQRSLSATLAEVEDFALGEYVLGLLKGHRMSTVESKRIGRKLVAYTGLPDRFVHNLDYRIPVECFTRELLRSERRVVGRLDSRVTGPESEAWSYEMTYDPSLAAITGPYAATLNHYVRSVLKVEQDLPYELLTSRVHPWDYSQATNKYLNVAQDLLEAMNHNEHLRIFVAAAYFDIATPYLAAKYTLDHLLHGSQADRVTYRCYEGGHMMYTRVPCLHELSSDLRAYLRAGAAAETV